MDERRVDALARRISGEILRPGDSSYEGARGVWNARIDRRPALIVRCAGTADVQAAVDAAREAALPLAVRGNGHSLAGETACEGGLLIDLKPMHAVSIDAEARTATVQPGATWGEFDAAAQAFGLATSGGTVSPVGVSGVALGGGEGWLTRKHGYTIDNVVGAEVVTVSGELVHASATSNADLFWALRGGGGNFGIVTAFQFALHEVGPELLAGQVMYPGDRATELLGAYRDYFAAAPDEVGCFLFLLRVPAIDAFPAKLHGTLMVDFVVAYVGPIADGERVLAPLRNLGSPIADTVAPTSFLALQQAFDATAARGHRWYSRANYLNALTDAAIDTVVANLDPFPGEFTSLFFGPGGGAIGRVAPDATAFPHRTAAHEMQIFPGWADAAADDEVMAWTRDLHSAIAPFTTGGAYVNYLADDEAARVPAAYGANYRRLRELKRAWDPDNLLRSNHNIPPAG